LKHWFKKKWGLALYLVVFIFAIMIAAMLLAGLFLFVFNMTDIEGFTLSYTATNVGWIRLFVRMIFFSCIIGVTLATIFGRKALKPIHRLIDATRKVAEGDFSTSVEIKGIYEFEELSNSFNKMTRELSSIETLRSDFISNFSHEFKTPIVSIRGFAKLLMEGNLTEDEKQEYLNIIMTESERLSNLSENILNLTKYEAIEIITEKKPFRLDEQVRRAILLTEPKWGEKEINIDIEMDAVTYNGNADLMQHIWLNLLDNAIKFTNKGGTIGVQLINSSDTISFCIQDDGAGMDEETVRHIFDKFYQGDKSHKQAGNGLGLAITKRIVELCGGTIHVDSSVQKGSIFTVVLPK
jgi:signal transduction histidine kinase